VSTVYAFEFCPCFHESEFGIVSMHKTKRGAFKALLAHKNQHWHDQRRQVLEYGKAWGKLVDVGWMELWRIKPYELQD